MLIVAVDDWDQVEINHVRDNQGWPKVSAEEQQGEAQAWRQFNLALFKQFAFQGGQFLRLVRWT